MGKVSKLQLCCKFLCCLLFLSFACSVMPCFVCFKRRSTLVIEINNQKIAPATLGGGGALKFEVSQHIFTDSIITHKL